MIKAAAISTTTDLGVASICLMARDFDISADPNTLIGCEIADGRSVTTQDLVRLAKKLGLEARLVSTKWKRLHNVPLPAIACLDDGSFLIAKRLFEEKIAVQHPMRSRAYLLNAAEFNYLWNGRLILLKPTKARSFDIRGLFAAAQRFFGLERRSAA